MAKGEIISEETGKIFQGIRNIIDEDEDQIWAQDTVLGHSNLHRKRRLEDLIKSYMLTTGVVEVSKPREKVALDTISREFGDQGGVPDCVNAQNLFREMAMISCLRLRACVHCWAALAPGR